MEQIINCLNKNIYYKKFILSYSVVFNKEIKNLFF